MLEPLALVVGLADEFVGELAGEDVVDDMSVVVLFQEGLEFLHERVVELVDVALDGDIDRVPVEVLEGLQELPGVV